MEYDFYKVEFDEKAHALAVEAVLGLLLRDGKRVEEESNAHTAFMTKVAEWLNVVHDRKGYSARVSSSDDTAARALEYARRIVEGPFGPNGLTDEQINKRQGSQSSPGLFGSIVARIRKFIGV
jgi:hypothetical protein